MRRTMVVAALLAMALTACGDSGEQATKTIGASAAYKREVKELRQQRAEERKVDEEVARMLRQANREDAAQEPPAPERAPENSRPIITKVQRESREFCSIFPLEKMAAEYGVAADVSAVAKAYASEYRPGLQGNAEQGCLEGLAR